MLHAYVERFDVMGGRGNILGWDGEVNKAKVSRVLYLLALLVVVNIRPCSLPIST
jgi:hypothetical protein